jgi:hypothetical protein
LAGAAWSCGFFRWTRLNVTDIRVSFLVFSGDEEDAKKAGRTEKNGSSVGIHSKLISTFTTGLQRAAPPADDNRPMQPSPVRPADVGISSESVS